MKRAVWPPGSAEPVRSRLPLITQVQHFVSQLTNNFWQQNSRFRKRFAKTGLSYNVAVRH